MKFALRQYLIAAVAAFAVFAAVGLGLNRHYAGKLLVAEANVTSAHDALVVALAQSASDSASAARLADSAAAQTRAAAREAAARKIVEAQNASLQAKFAAAASIAPDTCKQVVVAAKAVIDGKNLEIASLDIERDSLTSARDFYHSAYDKQVEALAHLTGPVARLDTAATTLVKTARSASFWQKIAPKPGVGIIAGYDPIDKHFVKGVGASLSWTF